MSECIHRESNECGLNKIKIFPNGTNAILRSIELNSIRTARRRDFVNFYRNVKRMIFLTCT